MSEEKYKILIEGVVYAENMSLDTSLILVKGLFQEYFKDDRLRIVIARMGDPKDDEELWQRSLYQ